MTAFNNSYLKKMANRVVSKFLEADDSIPVLLERTEPEEKKQIEELLAKPIYQKHLVNVPKKTIGSVEYFFKWQLLKHKSDFDSFLGKHPDFLTDNRTVSQDIQKIFGKLKDPSITMNMIENELYPNINNFKDTDFKKSENPYFKELKIPNMPANQKWVLITDEKGKPVKECRGEADAMGHCGKFKAGEGLSLRDEKGRSHITVERTPKKELTQLKWSGNRILRENLAKFRPYLPAIEALLMSDEVVSIADHEFQDISVLDLLAEHNANLLEKIEKEKPGLISSREKKILLPVYKKWWTGELNMDDLIKDFAI
jgi:hypothetical protein